MKLTYETATATLIQFIALGLLNIVNGLYSIIATCAGQTGDCVDNIFTSIIFYILVIIWFAFIVFLGYSAQEKRSKRYAQALIIAEGLVVLIAAFNLKHNSGFLGIITSAIDLVLAIWIITLAFRLMRSGGSRVVRHRRRRRSTS